MDYAAAYTTLHESWPKWFSGYSLLDCLPDLAEFFKKHGPTRILDYGCGKGYQYLRHRAHEAWGGQLPYCYDPGVRQISERPGGKFDGIICTDVMEHVDEADVDAVLADIFGLADERAAVFFNIACRPARSKKLPDGRNVHLTVQPPDWWKKKIARFKRDGLEIKTIYDLG